MVSDKKFDIYFFPWASKMGDKVKYLLVNKISLEPKDFDIDERARIGYGIAVESTRGVG